jgi:DNA-binding transcriptional regulator YhcF (GntR family)
VNKLAKKKYRNNKTWRRGYTKLRKKGFSKKSAAKILNSVRAGKRRKKR